MGQVEVYTYKHWSVYSHFLQISRNVSFMRKNQLNLKTINFNQFIDFYIIKLFFNYPTKEACTDPIVLSGNFLHKTNIL